MIGFDAWMNMDMSTTSSKQELWQCSQINLNRAFEILSISCTTKPSVTYYFGIWLKFAQQKLELLLLRNIKLKVQEKEYLLLCVMMIKLHTYRP